MLQRPVHVLLLCGAVCAALYVVWARGAWPKPEQLTLAYQISPLAAQVLVARDQKLFGRYGLEVTTIGYEDSLDVVDAMLRGDADVAVVDALGFVHAWLNRDGAVLIAVVGTSSMPLRVISTTDPGAYHSESRVAVPAGLTGQVLSSHPAVRRALTPGQVTLLATAAASAAFAAGEVEMVVGWEPFAAAAQVAADRAGRPARVDVLEAPVAVQTMLSTGEVLLKRRAALIRLMGSIDNASDAIMHDRQAAIDSLATELKLPSETVIQMWPNLSFVVSLDAESRKLLYENLRWLLPTMGARATGVPRMESSLDASLLDELRAAAPTKTRD